MFTIDSIDHVALAVRDVRRSAEWYQQVLGLSRLYEDAWGDFPAVVGAGGTSIALFPVEGTDPKGRPGRDVLTMRHLAFRVDARISQKRARRCAIAAFQWNSRITASPTRCTSTIPTATSWRSPRTISARSRSSLLTTTTEAHVSAPRRFYVALALVMTAMVIASFWQIYFGPLLQGNAARPWLFHLHGAVSMGWLALLVAQAALVSSGRTALHRRLGTIGIAYGWIVLAVGITISFFAPVIHMASGAWDLDAAAGFLLLPLGDMVLFAGFFVAAIVYRRTPEIHKRLMLLATVALLFAAIARRVPFEPPSTFLLVWLAPLLAAMAYDWHRDRRVHPVYAIGLALFVLAYARVFVMNSEPWLTIGRVLLAPLV